MLVAYYQMHILQNLPLNSSKMKKKIIAELKVYTIKIIFIECLYVNLNHQVTSKLKAFIANTYDHYSRGTSDRKHVSASNTNTCDYIQLCHFLKLLHKSTCQCHYHF